GLGDAGHDLALLAADVEHQLEQLLGLRHRLRRQHARDAQVDLAELLEADAPVVVARRRRRRRRRYFGPLGPPTLEQLLLALVVDARKQRLADLGLKAVRLPRWPRRRLVDTDLRAQGQAPLGHERLEQVRQDAAELEHVAEDLLARRIRLPRRL